MYSVPLSDGLEARLIDGDRWYKDNQYLYYEDRIVVPQARLDGCLQWAHHSSGHTGCNWSAEFFNERFYCPVTVRFSCNLYFRFFQCIFLIYVYKLKSAISALFWTVLVSVNRDFL